MEELKENIDGKDVNVKTANRDDDEQVCNVRQFYRV